MLTLQNPVAASHDKMPKPARKPLQPRNSNAINSTVAKLKSIIKRDEAPDSGVLKGRVKASEETGERDWNKENIPVTMEGFDSSLGEELIEARKRVERLKLDKEKTEEKLKERDALFELWREGLETRGKEQIKLEIEMDRLYRINELRALTRISPIRSLREKEETRFSTRPLSILKWDEDEMEESVGENSIGSPAGSTGNSGAVAEIID
uniref:Uncharacterized protein n=1 Tax=Kalanchoe fedtschenkoi TaxID=63787 RepID=A0A7N0T6U1_KALFE